MTGHLCRRGHDTAVVGVVVRVRNDRQSYRYLQCAECRREDNRNYYLRKYSPALPTRTLVRWLWEDNAAEYRLLRELGLTVAEIAEKAGLSGPAMERALYRHIGGKREW